MEKQLTVKIASVLLEILRKDFKLGEKDFLPKNIISEKFASANFLDFGLCYISHHRIGLSIREDEYIKSFCREYDFIYPENPFSCDRRKIIGEFKDHLQEFLNVRIKILQKFIDAGGYEGLNFPKSELEILKN